MRNHLIPICALLIVCLSLLTIYSVLHAKGALNGNSIFFRQLLWIVFGWLAFFIFSNIHYRKLFNFIYPFHIAVILLLMLVLIIGGVRLGAQRWIKIWWFNLQPSEFAKLAIVLVLSNYFSHKGLADIKVNTANLSFFKGIIAPFSIIAIPFLLILKQPDLGTALLLVLIFLAIVYFSAVKARYILLVAIIAIALSPVFWNFLKDYQKDRLLVFLNPNSDPLGAGYTIIQSKIAIGSGRFFGKGWLSGTQGQLNFLPESHTDFIFGVFSEETGFSGCIFILALYYLLINQAFIICDKTDDGFGKFFAFGVGIMLAFQVYINISMTLGLSPVVGLPLPLMSYGGSSMLVTFISLGILQNINRNG